MLWNALSLLLSIKKKENQWKKTFWKKEKKTRTILKKHLNKKGYTFICGCFFFFFFRSVFPLCYAYFFGGFFICFFVFFSFAGDLMTGTFENVIKKSGKKNKKRPEKNDKKWCAFVCFWFCFLSSFYLFHRFIEVACKPCHNLSGLTATWGYTGIICHMAILVFLLV